jgi:hypothetical protein
LFVYVCEISATLNGVFGSLKREKKKRKKEKKRGYTRKG